MDRQFPTLMEMEKQHILEVLHTVNSVTKAARLLGVSRAGLYSKLRRYEITAPRAARQLAGKDA